MKKLLVVLFGLLIAVAAFSQAPASVICDGRDTLPPWNCGPGGAAANNYFYKITAPSQPPQEVLLDIYVGTDDLNAANYTNVTMPPGWIFQVLAASPPFYPNPLNHYTGFTKKTFVSAGPNGTCPGYVYWSCQQSPVPTGNFGYDHPWTGHDVGWEVDSQLPPYPPPGAITISVENWQAPIGMGYGPVHGPSLQYYEPEPKE